LFRLALKLSPLGRHSADFSEHECTTPTGHPLSGREKAFSIVGWQIGNADFAVR